MVEVPFVCFGHYNLKIYKTQICHEISRQMNLAFHALVFCFNSKSWFSWVDEIASFGREKYDSYYVVVCLVFARNHSFVRQWI